MNAITHRANSALQAVPGINGHRRAGSGAYRSTAPGRWQ